MEMPTLFMVDTNRSSMLNRGSRFWKLLRMMNTLSIPMASTRNGITSEMMGVTATPAEAQVPTEMTREHMTMKMDPKPNRNLVRTKNMRASQGITRPRASEMYRNIMP